MFVNSPHTSRFHRVVNGDLPQQKNTVARMQRRMAHSTPMSACFFFVQRHLKTSHGCVCAAEQCVWSCSMTRMLQFDTTSRKNILNFLYPSYRHTGEGLMKATRDNSVKNLYPLLCKGKNNTRKAAPWLLSSEVPQMMFVTIMVESFVHECLRIIEKNKKAEISLLVTDRAK